MKKKGKIFLIFTALILSIFILTSCTSEGISKTEPEISTNASNNEDDNVETRTNDNTIVESDNETTISTNENSTSVKEVSNSEKPDFNYEGTGIEDSSLYDGQYTIVYYAIESRLIKYVFGENLNEFSMQEWSDEMDKEREEQGKNNLLVDKYSNLREFINYFNIPKEKFIELTKYITPDPDTGATCRYSDEQIDALYSDDIAKINELFVSEYAFLIDGKIYTADWLLKTEYKDWKEVGLTKKMIEEKKEKYWDGCFYNVILKQIEEKLEKFEN